MDDLLDRAKDLETHTKDAITDVVDDDDDENSTSAADVASLKASLASLQAKVDELTALQAKSSKS